MNDLINIISTVGFPIFAFLICVYALKYCFDKSMTQNNENMETISKLADSINENTKALVELTVIIKEGEEKKC